MKLMRLLIAFVLCTFTVAKLDEEFDDDEEFENVPVLDGESDLEELSDDQFREVETKMFEKPVYKPPVAKGNVYFTEAFETETDFNTRWIKSQSLKDGAEATVAKYDGSWRVEAASEGSLQGDLGLVLKNKARHHAISAKLNKPFVFSGQPFIVQYEVKFQEGQECGGAYIKLLTDIDQLDLSKFNDKTGYTVMFGPDKCGMDTKIHFIFRHKNPMDGSFEEKHAKKPSGRFDHVFTDKKTHLYTLVIKSDNSFTLYIDQDLFYSGSLFNDMTPPVNPPNEVADPEDKKPSDWDERERIPDPDSTRPADWDESEPEMLADGTAVKPFGWLDDEPELIASPDADKPHDWDDDMDGEWEAPMISNPVCESAPGCGVWQPPQIKNPKYNGKWLPPMMDNPDYKGKWSPRMITNPNYFEDKKPYEMTTIGALGLELWSMSENILFDNFIITDEKSVADEWAADSWTIKRQQELAGSGAAGIFASIIDATRERPWLWIIIIIAFVLPVVILIAYCCSPSKASDIDYKKTDEPTLDEPEEEEEEDSKEEEKFSMRNKNEEPLRSESDENKSPQKSNKSSLEVNNGDEADVEDKPVLSSNSPHNRKPKARKE